MFKIKQIIQSLSVSPCETKILGALMITVKTLLQTLTNAKFESLQTQRKYFLIVSELLAACSYSLTINILKQN
jgi:hypothetical protein